MWRHPAGGYTIGKYNVLYDCYSLVQQTPSKGRMSMFKFCIKHSHQVEIWRHKGSNLFLEYTVRRCPISQGRVGAVKGTGVMRREGGGRQRKQRSYIPEQKFWREESSQNIKKTLRNTWRKKWADMKEDFGLKTARGHVWQVNLAERKSISTYAGDLTFHLYICRDIKVSYRTLTERVGHPWRTITGAGSDSANPEATTGGWQIAASPKSERRFWAKTSISSPGEGTDSDVQRL